MRAQLWDASRGHLGLALKCGAVLFLFLISVLVVACGANNTAQAPGDPPVTVTINLNQTFSSPTPDLAPYQCGAWVTNTTPAFVPGAPVMVYAKFVHIVNGNPQGIGGVHAEATYLWPGDTPASVAATTTADGLAVFQAPMSQNADNHVVIVDVTFNAPAGGQPCSDITDNNGHDDGAFFTPIDASPTVTPPGGGGGGGGGGNGSPIACPTIFKFCQTPSPGPTRTVTGG